MRAATRDLLNTDRERPDEVNAGSGRHDAHYGVVRFGGSPERPAWVEDADVDG